MSHHSHADVASKADAVGADPVALTEGVIAYLTRYTNMLAITAAVTVTVSCISP